MLCDLPATAAQPSTSLLRACCQSQPGPLSYSNCCFWRHATCTRFGKRPSRRVGHLSLASNQKNPIDHKHSHATAPVVTMAATRRKPIHEQPKLCDHILSRVSKSGVSLRIGPSLIPEAGSGLFAVNDIPAGTEIFRTSPLLMVAESAHTGICDFCFLNRATSVNRDGRFYSSAEDDVRPEITRCASCRVARYCSKVRDVSSFS